VGATSLQELFEHELGDIYFAEHRMVEAYEAFAANSDDQGLTETFEAQRERVGDHIERLVEIFDTMGEPPQEEECQGIEASSASTRSSFPRGRTRTRSTSTT